MNPAKTLGVIMVLYGAVAVGFAIETGKPPGPLLIAVSAALIVAGVLTFLERPVAYWFSIGAGLFTFAAGLASSKLPPNLRMPIQPILPIVVGLYVCVRVALTKSARPGRRPDRDGDRDDAGERSES